MFARLFALTLGSFCLLNLLAGRLLPGFDANIWWIHPPLPVWLASPLLAGGASLLVAYALAPRPGPRRRRATRVAVVGLLLACQYNALVFYGLLLRAELSAGFPVSTSLLIALGLVAVLVDLRRHRPSRLVCWRAAALAAGCLAGFPLLQMFCFGKTDYRRPADAIVVFGARAYADGTPSQALADRVRTGCRLYQQGYARYLVFSGGPGDGRVHETESMRRMARSLGVPDSAILLDPRGLNTRATVRQTERLFARRGIEKVLAVSHYFHLPRIKMAYRRAGREVYTVPARETYVLTQTPYLLARETAACWWYYLRPLLSA